MSERFIRCTHCGLPHDAHVQVCPTTGLRIKRDEAQRRRRRAATRQRSEQPELILGWIIDNKYRLKSVIGQGGMSAIYEAEELTSGRRVALKVLHPSLSDDREAIERLRREAEVVSEIGHHNICAVFDTGRAADGSPYMVMERLFGESLAERIRSLGPRPFTELGPLLCQVLAALQAAHDKHILHRDLKPENLFVEQPDNDTLRAKLLDFGISKSMGSDFTHQQRLTHTGMVMGTPYYMAPEQARGDSGLDQRVDLWAVGVILYEGLSGRRPFVATNYNALLVKILTSSPTPIREVMPNLPGDVVAIVDKALSKEPDDRFQSADEFSEAIRVVLVRMAPDDGPTEMQLPAWQPEVAFREDAQTRREPAARWLEEEACDTDRPPDDGEDAGADTEVIAHADLASLSNRDMADTTEDHAARVTGQLSEHGGVAAAVAAAAARNSEAGSSRRRPRAEPRASRRGRESAVGASKQLEVDVSGPLSTSAPSSMHDTEIIRREEHTALRQLIVQAKEQAAADDVRPQIGKPPVPPAPPALFPDFPPHRPTRPAPPKRSAATPAQGGAQGSAPGPAPSPLPSRPVSASPSAPQAAVGALQPAAPAPKAAGSVPPPAAPPAPARPAERPAPSSPSSRGRSRPAPPRPDRPRRPLSAAPPKLSSRPPEFGERSPAPKMPRSGSAVLAAPRTPPLGSNPPPALRQGPPPAPRRSPSKAAGPPSSGRGDKPLTASQDLPDLGSLEDTSDDEATTVYDVAAARRQLAARHAAQVAARRRDDGGDGHDS